MIRVAILALLLSCAPDSETLVVFAASSLTEAFEELERDYERAHPEIDVQLVFAGSQVLRLQIEQGAHADVLATANDTHMRALLDAGLASDSQSFAHNELVLITPPGGIQRFEDLDQTSRIVLGTRAVPIGIYAREMLERAREELGAEFSDAVHARVVSEENNARLVRAKVELGEADAAFVYRTDLNDRVHAVSIPETLNAHATYSIATLSTRGEAFRELVLSPAGQDVLRRHGFSP